MSHSCIHTGTSTKCTYIYNHARSNAWPETAACTIQRTVRHASAISSTYKPDRENMTFRNISPIYELFRPKFGTGSDYRLGLYIYFLIGDFFFFFQHPGKGFFDLKKCFFVIRLKKKISLIWMSFPWFKHYFFEIK